MFDIIVPTYNRYNALSDFFTKISLLDKNIYTLWLIDDCSADKNVFVIPNWPNIKYIELTKNVGQAEARNYAIKNGTAPYIISLDDDAWFLANSTDILKIIDAFEKYPDAGCLMFNIKTPNSSFKPNIDGELLPLHVTCGCAYRRLALEQIGGFTSLIQGQGEESDLSLKLYKSGWTIRSLYNIHVYHDFDPDSRSIDWYKKVRYKETRNSLIVVFLNFPLISLFWFLPGKAASQLLYAFKAKKAVIPTFIISLKGIVDFVKMVPSLKKIRSPLAQKTFKYWRQLNN